MDESILARLDRIERRLDALEGRFGPSRPPIVESPSRSAVDLEEQLGTQWLPRIGSAAVIGAIAYLIGLGLQRGLITPAMVAWGIALVCGAVAALGTRLRGRRESFGNVLVGLGAGGLYVDAVGAHFYHELLSGEAMVGTCFIVSLAVLAFGARRGLPAMLGIGLTGGLMAALMPFAKGSTTISATLLLLVAAPTFAVAAARRWPSVAAGAWGACSLAALAFLFSSASLAVRLGPLDAVLFMALAAWAFAGERFPAVDPLGAFPFVAAVAAGGSALAVWSGPAGVLHVEALGLGLGLIGLVFRHHLAGDRVLAAGVILALVVAPLGARSFFVPLLLSALAIVESVVLRRRLAPIIAIQALLAGAAYLLLLTIRMTEGHLGPAVAWEPGLIVLIGAAAVMAAVAVDRVEARLAAGVAVWGLASRTAMLFLGLAPSAAITVAWIVTFAGLLALGFALRRPELRHLGLFVAAVTAGKVLLVDLADLDAATKAVMLLFFGVVLLIAGFAYVRWAGRAEEEPAAEP